MLFGRLVWKTQCPERTGILGRIVAQVEPRLGHVRHPVGQGDGCRPGEALPDDLDLRLVAVDRHLVQPARALDEQHRLAADRPHAVGLHQRAGGFELDDRSGRAVCLHRDAEQRALSDRVDVDVSVGQERHAVGRGEQHRVGGPDIERRRPFLEAQHARARRVGDVDGAVLRDGHVVADAVARERVARLERRVLEAECLHRCFADDRRAAAPAAGRRADPERARGFVREHAEHGLQAVRLRLDPDAGLFFLAGRAVHAVLSDASDVQRAVLRGRQALGENPSVGECDLRAIGGLQAAHRRHDGRTNQRASLHHQLLNVMNVRLKPDATSRTLLLVHDAPDFALLAVGDVERAVGRLCDAVGARDRVVRIHQLILGREPVGEDLGVA